MEEYKNGKIERVLGIYTKPLNGYIVNKAAEANEYGVNERSIQRDVDDIRNYLELEAVNSGVLDYKVYASYLKLRREAWHFSASEHEKRKKEKSFTKLVEEVKNRKANR